MLRFGGFNGFLRLVLRIRLYHFFGFFAFWRFGRARRRGGLAFLIDVNFDGDSVVVSVNLAQSLLDITHIMPFDPCFDEIVVGSEHDEAVAHSLRLQAREKSAHLRFVDGVILRDLSAYALPCCMKFFAVH